MTSLFYVLLELVKFSITVALKEVPKKMNIKVKAKNYVILVEFAKLLIVILTVFVVPYIAPQLTQQQQNTEVVQ